MLRSQINQVTSKADYAKEKQSDFKTGVAVSYFPLANRMEPTHARVKDGNEEKYGSSPPQVVT